MPWIELHHGFPGHKKVGDLAKAMGVERRVAIGTLACLWSWAVAMTRHGDVTGMEEEIAHATYFRGEPGDLMHALTQAGWVDRDEATGVLTIHDWDDYAGRYEEAKSKARERKRAERDRKKAERVTVTSRGSHTDGPSDGHAEVTPHMYMTNTSTVPLPEQERDRREPTPKGVCVPQAAHAAPAGVDALVNSRRQEQVANAGHQEPQEQASSLPQGQRHPPASADGLPGAPAKLSTGYPQKAYPPAFEALWKSAPQPARTRSGKPKAYAAWVKAIKRAQPEAIAAGLEAFKASWDWRKDGGAYVPGLHLWLGREVWDERPSTQEPPAGARGQASGSRGGVTGGFTDEYRAKLLERIGREEQAITVEVTHDQG